MISPTNAVDLQSLPPVLLGLFLFGCAYAWLVYSLGERKVGYVALFVVLGVIVTLGGLALVDWRAAALGLVCFAASGAPMVAGEIIQHIQARERAIQEHRERAIQSVKEMEHER